MSTKVVIGWEAIEALASRDESTPQPTITQLTDEIVRITWPLPLGIDHVYCHLVRVDNGGWMLVDTGLGLPGIEAPWAALFASLDAPVTTILITHSHPDHVGGAGIVQQLTGAPVLQGEIDRARLLSTWGDHAAAGRLADHLVRHGSPAEEAALIEQDNLWIKPMVYIPQDPALLSAGDIVHGWKVVHLPGHADGHICLLRDGVLLAGDVILDPITPAVGLFGDGEPDPLADYLNSLARLETMGLQIAYSGHGTPIEDVPARARAIGAHHAERLKEAADAVREKAMTASDVARVMFPRPLTPPQRRFAIVETLAHLEYLARRNQLERHDRGQTVEYGAA